MLFGIYSCFKTVLIFLFYPGSSSSDHEEKQNFTDKCNSYLYSQEGSEACPSKRCVRNWGQPCILPAKWDN